jgi:O-acetyl-ADP-ribose deacetylase (regulator of RNase III)/NAD-dependent SIR2 family protein deacetylase
MTATPPFVELSKAVAYLTEHATPIELAFLARHYPMSEDLETWDELCILKMLLCHRGPTPPLPAEILDAIDAVLFHEQSQKFLTSPSTITSRFPTFTLGNNPDVKICLWKGDITTLTETTAIVNAANSRMLGCFVPHHKCIDNAIHAAAGPRLREECFALMSEQGFEEKPGQAKVTSAYCLPSEYVLHTVGPILKKGATPTDGDIYSLRQCYVSCLEACEKLPGREDGQKVLAFCCISTGIFSFPQQTAAENAILAVKHWLASHPHTTITKIIFNVFIDTDYDIYLALLQSESQLHAQPNLSQCSDSLISVDSSLALASHWLSQASHLLITAGAGLSASSGLDYTSTSLFSARFPAFCQPPYNFTRLYDLFRPIDWPSEEARWGYYFHHLLMIRLWPRSTIYQNLLAISSLFSSENTHVRTSNADGLFLANGFPQGSISTPQGQYAYLQCSRPCRVSATFPTAPFVDAAIPYLDPGTQMLTDTSKIPLCKYCGGKVIICVRSGDAFIEAPFEGQEKVYLAFRQKMLHASHHHSGDNCHKTEHGFSPKAGVKANDEEMQPKTNRKEELSVILSLGVGLSTPGVLRWPNEDLVTRGSGNIKLIRIGLEAAGCADWGDDNMVGIQGDVGSVLETLLVGLSR